MFNFMVPTNKNTSKNCSHSTLFEEKVVLFFCVVAFVLFTSDSTFNTEEFRDLRKGNCDDFLRDFWNVLVAFRSSLSHSDIFVLGKCAVVVLRNVYESENSKNRVDIIFSIFYLHFYFRIKNDFLIVFMYKVYLFCCCFFWF